ncbi:FMN-dependent NADH-azoreductase [Glaciecola siphonariae]|uniref:FMN dependent NADH:quinone oxidoreductase n=1 Tax=Glaciecola siphonariae TaxID=521012 RepID=A0ABV9LTS4_9ALTE
MSYILRIDASPRHDDSHSRQLADVIIQNLRLKHTSIDVKQRDIYLNPIEHISNDTINGFFSSPEQLTKDLLEATRLSDELIAELKGAQIIIISSPLYNFSIPSGLKAWIDQIVRINQTFSYDETGFSGSVDVPEAYLALSYGAEGYAPGGALASMNFLEPYLVSLLGFLGIKQTHTFRIEGTSGDAVTLSNNKQIITKLIKENIVGVKNS